MSFHPDTQIPYMVDAAQTLAKLSYLTDLFVAVDKPILALSLTKEGIIQQANAVAIGVTELTNSYYTMTLSNDAVIICTPTHKWSMNKASNSKTLTTSALTGFTYQETRNIAVGDEIVATNQNKYLKVESIVLTASSYIEYMCMKVPMFGNFLVDAGDTMVVSCTC